MEELRVHVPRTRRGISPTPKAGFPNAGTNNLSIIVNGVALNRSEFKTEDEFREQMKQVAEETKPIVIEGENL